MKSYEWKLTDESREGSSCSYRYAREDFPGVTITVIESQATSSDRGATLQHEFIVEDRSSGYKKTFDGPFAARRFAERRLAIKAKRLEKAIKKKRRALI